MPQSSLQAADDHSGKFDHPPRAVYAGLFLITLSTLLLQLGLTRIFSVIMYYHMAFFAVSVTLFGMAFGAVIVHFMPRVFTPARAPEWMAWMAAGFAASTVGALGILLGFRFDLTRNSVIIGQLFLVSVALSVPFTCSGVAVALALTRFPRRTNILYGFDLAGAAAGCLLFGPVIYHFGGPGLVFFASLVVMAGGLLVSLALNSSKLILVMGLLTLAIGGLFHQAGRIPIFQLRHIRGATMPPASLAYDAWNSISRITGISETGHATGVAPRNHEASATEQITLLIDTFAATPLIKFDGNKFADLFYPFHDVSYAVHPILKDARVAVIGVGGGRDVLAAKAWGQPEVTGIEINSRILEALTKRFEVYGGRPLAWPGVTIVQDEARSYLARGNKRFDIIQASLIDTFAATAAGAFVLTENSLYTLEGWQVFLDHLTDRGILTMTRWYTERNPVESVRLLALARAALEARGAARPLDHVMMLRAPAARIKQSQPLATILVKKTPFLPDQVSVLEEWAAANGLTMLATPRGVTAPELSGVIESDSLRAFTDSHPFDVSPPTDDRPFFFDVLRWRDVFKKEYRQGSNYIYSINLKPLVTLGTLLATVCAMAFLFIVVPLAFEKRIKDIPQQVDTRDPFRARLGRLCYFVMLGLGYIMIELTLMQRLSVFLGHPGYSLTVCLFTMLLASGLGAAAAGRIFLRTGGQAGDREVRRANLCVFALLLATLPLTLWIMARFVAEPTPLRIALAGAALAPAAFFMGMPFPLGIQAAARKPGAPLAWYWGINGAFSVCASVAVVALGHSFGLEKAYLCGTICYLIAGLAAGAFATPAPTSSRSQISALPPA